MNKFYFLLFVLFSFSSFRISGKEILVTEAEKIASAFLSKDLSSSSVKRMPQKQLLLAYTEHDDNMGALYYVFNHSNGFVVVSADDEVTPIIGYSDGGGFDMDSIPENMKSFLNLCKDGIKKVIDANSNLYISEGGRDTTVFAPFVAPLLGNINFAQSEPYNEMCPKYNGENTLVGCVAVSMGQIMKYYEYPLKGDGGCSFTTKTHKLKVAADFSSVTYDWENILSSYVDNDYTPVQVKAVSELLFHCGASVQMDYSVGGSSASEDFAAYTLVNNFGYDDDIDVKYRFMYTQDEWIDLIKKELNEKRPVIYCGICYERGGHAFNCDGYDENGLFHINWGWNGRFNGYFDLRLLNDDNTKSEESHYGYTKNQSVIVGIQPKKADSKRELHYKIVSRNGIYYDGEVKKIGFEVTNYGLNLYGGEFAVGIFSSDDSLMKVVSPAFTYLSPSQPYSYSVSVGDLLVEESSLKIKPIYKPSGDSDWLCIEGGVNTPMILFSVYDEENLNLDFIYADSRVSELDIVSLNSIGNIYRNRMARFDLSIKNIGDFEYYGLMKLELVNVKNTSKRVSSAEYSVTLKSGESGTYEIVLNTLNLMPGDYYCNVYYDIYNGSWDNLVDKSNAFKFVVLDEPTGDFDFYLKDKLSFKDDIEGLSLTWDEVPILVANIENLGSFGQLNVTPVVFSPEGLLLGNMPASVVVLDSNECKLNLFKCYMSTLEDGDYYMRLHYYNPFDKSQSWHVLRPFEHNKIAFSIRNGVYVDVESVDDDQFLFYPTNVTSYIHIESKALIEGVKVLDMSGIVVSDFVINAFQIDLDVNFLRQGIYLCLVKTADKVEMVKIHKL